MGAWTSRNDSARRRSFVPELEVLEGRCCPTVTSTFKGGVLTITGNGDDDVVAITAQMKAITVVADGFVPIRWLDVVVPFTSQYRAMWLGLGTLAQG